MLSHAACRWWFFGFLLLLIAVLFPFSDVMADATNVIEYRDTISDSKPGQQSNHTFEFTLLTDVAPGGYFDFVPPADFTVVSTSTFGVRNVEMAINGVVRDATTTPTATLDGVTITNGTPGSIRYTLNSTTGVSEGDRVRVRIGNHTANTIVGSVSFSTTTGTTTIAGDIPGIQNGTTTGTQQFTMTINGGAEPAYAEFQIAIVEGVGVGVDTTEEVPPFRFNGAPEGEVGGTTLSVELSLETDEFSSCRYSSSPDTNFNSMTDTFDQTLSIVHTKVVSVASSGVYRFYVRCIDDEGNFNIDDYLIQFTRLDTPQGTANEEGSTDGDGTGSGDEGSGTGQGAGGSSGGESGEESTTGELEGGGGTGGGGGGGSGGGSGSQGGGGFESSDDVFESGDAEVVISGYAFPGSLVVTLVDGQIAEQVRANSSGSFSITIEDIARGVYTFGVYAVDANGVQSTPFSTTFSVIGAKTSSLSNVNIMPSIDVNPDPVDIGSSVTFSGYSIPNATITIENQREGSSASRQELTTTSNSSGEWSLTLGTNGFSQGTYQVRAKAEQIEGLGIETDYSGYTFYGVGQEADRGLNPDLNRDGNVNLIDFSILLFWWNTDGGTSDPPADINGDGDVSLTDFSILLFNWTG